MTELLVRQIGRHPVLLGPTAAHAGGAVHHPGPIALYMLAVPYRMLGSSAGALGQASLAIHATAAVGSGFLVRRRLGAGTGALALVLLGVTAAALGPIVLTMPWNPYLGVFVLPLAVIAVWCVLDGDVWVAPIAGLSVSFMAQTHLGYVPLATLLGALTIWGLVRRRDEPDGRSRRAGLTTAAVVALSLVPPAVEGLWGRPGNLAALVQSLDAPAAVVGWSAAARYVASQLGVSAVWLHQWGHGPGSISDQRPWFQSVPLGLAGLGAGVILARRQNRWQTANLGMLVGACLAVATLAISRLGGSPYEYLAIWLVPLVALVWLPLGDVARHRFASQFEWCVLIVAPLLMAVALIARSADSDERARAAGTAIDAMVAASTEVVDPGDRVVVDFDGTFDAGPYQTGLLLALKRQGIDAVGPPSMSAYLGGHSSARPRDRGLPRLVVASLDAGRCQPDGDVIKTLWTAGPMPRAHAPASGADVAESPPIDLADDLSARAPHGPTRDVGLFLVRGASPTCGTWAAGEG